MLLEELKWEGPQTMEEVVTWGILPMQGLLERLDEYCQPSVLSNHPEDPAMVFFYYDFKVKIKRLEKTLYRLMDEIPNDLKMKPDEPRPESNPYKIRENINYAKKVAFLKSVLDLPEEEQSRVYEFLKEIVFKDQEKADVDGQTVSGAENQTIGA